MESRADSYRSIVVGITIVLVVSSCHVGIPITTTKQKIPGAYSIPGDSVTSATLSPEDFFQDTCLLELLNAAVINNQDMRIASEKIKIAQAAYAVSRSFLLPQLNAKVGNTTRKIGEYTMDGIGNDDTNKSDRLPPDKIIPNPYPEWFTGVTFSWEVNLWHKLANQKRADMSRYLSSAEMRHGVITWLISEIASRYYTLMALDREMQILHENYDLQSLAYEVVKVQKAGGRVTQVAVDQFESQLLNTQARMIRLRQEILESVTQINQLVGRYPEPIKRMDIQHYREQQQIAVGTPEQLFINRPDIRAAEMLLQASNYDVAVARAALYPSFTISGNAGFSAFDLSKLFFTPGSAVYTIASGVSAPVFQRKRIRAMLEASNARQRAALIQYEKTVLQGYNEAYLALSNFYNLKDQIIAKQLETEAMVRAFNNSRDLFQVGFASYLEVITVQRRLLDVQLELTNLKKEQLINLTVIYRAIGGGWQN